MTNRHAAAEDVGTVCVHPGEAVTNYTVTALHPVHTNITASAEAAGTNTVTVHIADFAGPPPQLSFAGHTPTNIPVRFMIVCKDNGSDPATTPQNCSNLVWNANRILDQVGITLELQSIAQTNRQDWYELDPMNNTTSMQLLASLPSGNGFEVYIVNEFGEFYGSEIGGFLALFGIAVDDGVVMHTYIEQRIESDKPRTREQVRACIIEAGARRIRPCLMTTATTFLALLPILTSTGRGSDLLLPMALPIIGGITLGVFDWFTVPVLACAVEERKLAAHAGRAPQVLG